MCRISGNVEISAMLAYKTPAPTHDQPTLTSSGCKLTGRGTLSFFVLHVVALCAWTTIVLAKMSCHPRRFSYNNIHASPSRSGMHAIT